MGESAASKGVSPARFRQLVAVTTVLLTLIVATGAAVRLTESGLGCEDWPGCTEERFVPEWEFHHWVEFGNRLLSGAAGIPTIALLVAAYRRNPRNAQLTAGAWAIAAGVLAQVIVGMVVVRLDLQPLAVATHYLLSVFILWVGIWMWFRADPDPRPTTTAPNIHNLSALLVGLSLVTLVLGTLVTGTGPHGGDSRADRLSFELSSIVRAHSVSAWILVAIAVALVLKLGATRPLQAVVASLVAQGAIGYIQYALGVPVLLVELHVIGSVVVFAAIVWHHYSLGTRADAPTPTREAVGAR